MTFKQFLVIFKNLIEKKIIDVNIERKKKYNKNETFVVLEIVNFFLISLFARKHIKHVRISELT